MMLHKPNLVMWNLAYSIQPNIKLKGQFEGEIINKRTINVHVMQLNDSFQIPGI